MLYRMLLHDAFKEDQWTAFNCECCNCKTKMFVEQEYNDDVGDSLYVVSYDQNNKEHTTSEYVVCEQSKEIR